MRLLLDTHVFLWAVLASPHLKPSARRLIDESPAVFVSPVSIWEVAIKSALGKLDVSPAMLTAEIGKGGFIELPVTARHAARVADLPLIHHDPFDRLLIAQALSEPLILLTADAALRKYGPVIQTI
jgi:PIN domain nuclease of toxin-antitoxin system